MFVSFVCLCAFVADVSYAQVLPGSADPGRFQRQFEAEFLPHGMRADPVLTFPSEVLIPQAAEGFILNGIAFAGMSDFARTDLGPMVQRYIGRKVDLTVLNHLSARITQYYHAKGYFLSRALVEPQEVTGGIVKIRVIEGYANVVRFEDPEGLLSSDILSLSNRVKKKIKALNPLHAPSLERYLLLLNDGGLSVQSILSAVPNAAVPGAVDVVLKIKKRPPSVSMGYNNHGSRFIGPHQGNIKYSFSGVLSPYDRLSFQNVFSLPLRELQYGSVSYALPLTEEGLRLDVSASYSNSNPGLNLRDLEVEGDSTSIEVGLNYPIIRSRRTNFNVGGTFAFKNNAVEFLDSELIDDKIRYVSLYTDIQHLDQWRGVNRASVSVAKGLNILEAKETGAANLSRAEGLSDFVKVEAQISRRQRIGEHWSVSGSIEGQYAPDPLLSSQEFGYGGINVGRGYDSSEITGDQGVSGALEVSYSGIEKIEKLDLSISPFAFYDVGKVWNNDTGGEALSAASAGIGVNYQFKETLNGTLQIAWPLTKKITTPAMGGGENGPRILFDLNHSF